MLKQVVLLVNSLSKWKHNIVGDIMLSFLIIKIFFARIIDVSLGTYKTLLTVKGKMILPTIIAFIEIIIWFYVAREALMINERSFLIPVSYAAGYAVGGLIGSALSNKLINSVMEVKIYNFNKKIIDYLNENKIDYYHFNKKLIVFYLSKKEDDHKIDKIHEISKNCIIYTKEVKKEKLKKCSL